MSAEANNINGSVGSVQSIWTSDELMHGKVGSPEPSSPIENGTNGSGSPNKHKHSRFSMRKMGHGKKPPADPMDWGMPGHLTEEEVAIFVSLKCLSVCLIYFMFVCLVCFSLWVLRRKVVKLWHICGISFQ